MIERKDRVDPSVQDRATQDRLHRLCRWYIRVAFFYLALGLLLGAGMLAFGNDNFQFVHTHMLLIGFVLIPTMFFGLPRVASIGWAEVQFWLANVGLAGMLVGAVMPVGLGLDRISVLFGLVETAAGILFAALIGKTIKGRS
jgi:hypothetical protein